MPWPSVVRSGACSARDWDSATAKGKDLMKSQASGLQSLGVLWVRYLARPCFQMVMGCPVSRSRVGERRARYRTHKTPSDCKPEACDFIKSFPFAVAESQSLAEHAPDRTTDGHGIAEPLSPGPLSDPTPDSPSLCTPSVQDTSGGRYSITARAGARLSSAIPSST